MIIGSKYCTPQSVVLPYHFVVVVVGMDNNLKVNVDKFLFSSVISFVLVWMYSWYYFYTFVSIADVAVSSISSCSFCISFVLLWYTDVVVLL